MRTELADGTDLADESHLLDLTGKPHVTEFNGFKPVTETFKQVDQNTIEITLSARPTELLKVAQGELTRPPPAMSPIRLRDQSSFSTDNPRIDNS